MLHKSHNILVTYILSYLKLGISRHWNRGSEILHPVFLRVPRFAELIPSSAGLEAVPTRQPCLLKAGVPGKADWPMRHVQHWCRTSTGTAWMNTQGRVPFRNISKMEAKVHFKRLLLNNSILNFNCLSFHSLPTSNYSVGVNLLVYFSWNTTGFITWSIPTSGSSSSAPSSPLLLPPPPPSPSTSSSLQNQAP